MDTQRPRDSFVEVWNMARAPGMECDAARARGLTETPEPHGAKCRVHDALCAKCSYDQKKTQQKINEN